ncbi:hypothetical protein JCM8547_002785 [Rhodosporidiobolus lusitaniae]
MHSFYLLSSLSALALLLAAGPANSYSLQPRHKLSNHQHALRSRRSLLGPRRLDKKAEQASLKCLSSTTFAICDGDDCTEQGEVAAGTICSNGTITWDPSTYSAPAASKSSFAGAVEEPVSSTSSARKSSSTAKQSASSPSPVEQTTSATRIAVQHAASTKSRSTVRATIPYSSSPAAASTASSSKTRTSTEVSKATASATTTTTTTTIKTTSAAATSSAVVSFSSVGASTKTTSKPVTSMTTSAAASATSGSSATGVSFTGGTATHYSPSVGLGACGYLNADTEKVVALGWSRFGDLNNNAPDCDRTVTVKNLSNGKTVSAKVVDRCPGCDYNSLDMSPGAWDEISETLASDIANDVGRITWEFTL